MNYSDNTAYKYTSKTYHKHDKQSCVIHGIMKMKQMAEKNNQTNTDDTDKIEVVAEIKGDNNEDKRKNEAVENVDNDETGAKKKKTSKKGKADINRTEKEFRNPR